MGVWKNKSRLMSVADFFWSSCVIAPLVVTYWRGTWDLLDDWVSPLPLPTLVVMIMSARFIPRRSLTWRPPA